MKRKLVGLLAGLSLIFISLVVIQPATSNAIECPLGTVGVTYPPAQDEFGNTVFGYDTCSVDAKAAMDFYYDELARIAQRIEQMKPKSGPDCVDLGVVFQGTSYEANYGVQCGSDVAMFTQMRSNHIAWVTEQIRGTGSPSPSPSPTPVADGCIDFGYRYKNTQYEVNYGIVCSPEYIATVRKAIVDYDAWVAAQAEPPKVNQVILPTEEQLLDPFGTKKSASPTSTPAAKPGKEASPKASATTKAGTKPKKSSTPKASTAPKVKTISCSKGTKTIKVSEVKPKCPAGYKRAA